MADNKAKQTKLNFYTNIAALVANILVGIYYTPYLVKSLGLAAYGVLPLAMIINQYIGVATQTLTHAYTRFYSVALQKGDYQEASKDISTSLVVVILISILLVPVGILIILKANHLFQVPSELLRSTRILFGYTMLSFLVSLLSSLMNVTLYAINRLDLMNVMKIIRVIFKLVVVVILFETIKVDISLVGLTNLLTEIIVLAMSIYLFFKFKPSEVHISFNLYDNAILASILTMSAWVLIQLCGDTLLYRTDNLIVNHYWGTIASGALGAISEIGNYASVVVSVIGSLFGPLILRAYAKGNHNEVKTLFIEQSTIVGCLSAILTGVISGCGFAILNVWLDNGMGIYQWWLLLKMVVLPFYAAGGIMAFVYRSWNKMKFPAIGTIILGIIDIVILVCICELAKPENAMPVLIISAFFSFAQCYVLNAISVSKIYKECRKKFMPISLKILITFCLSFMIGKFTISIINIQGLVSLAAVLIILGVLMLSIVYFVILNSIERNKLLSIIK